MIQRGLGEIAGDIELASGSWSVVVCDEDNLDQTADELCEELEFVLEDSGGAVVSVDAGRGVESVVEQLCGLASTNDVALVHQVESLDSTALRRLDQERTRLAGGARVVLVMSETALAALANNAPHLWSWVGSRVFSVNHDVGRLDVEARLASLRQGTGLTDDEVIRRAEAGTLPPDPIYAEWLILLDRGELIGA